MATLDDAIEFIRLGNRDEGREVLEEILEEDEESDEGWLWMSAVVDDDDERKICLENVVAINPDNAVAQRALDAINNGTFDLNDMLSDALESREEKYEDEDDDQYEDDDDDDDDDTSSSGKSSGGLNVRMIILAVFALVVICGLGGMAAYNMFLAPTPTDGTQPTAAPAQNGGDQPEQQATATPGPTSTPTNTPTPTETPFELPPAPPTEEPTPTATQVVPPTPQ